MTDAAEVLHVERGGPVAIFTITRPEAHNALNSAVLCALGAALAAVVHDARVGAIVITGTGQKAFSAGADLIEIAGLDAEAAGEVLSVGQRTFRLIEQAPVPIVTAVNGLALGGGFELVLASTFPIVSSNASFGLPESGLGLIPGYGGTQRLPRLVGKAAAAHLMLTGERLSADRAFQLGLTPLPPVEPDELLQTARNVAATMATRGPRAHEAILRTLLTTAPTDDQLALEATLAALAAGSGECAEGIAAFRERRSPNFPPRRSQQ